MLSTPPAATVAAVDSFRPYALLERWDEPEVVRGRCWDVANSFAIHARDRGLKPRLWRVRELGERRPCDRITNFVVLDDFAVDFASRGLQGAENVPFPVLEPLDVFLGDRGERLPLCERCGTSDQLDHSPDRCDGPHPKSWHVSRARGRLQVAFLNLSRAATVHDTT